MLNFDIKITHEYFYSVKYKKLNGLVFTDEQKNKTTLQHAIACASLPAIKCISLLNISGNVDFRDFYLKFSGFSSIHFFCRAICA